MKEIYAMRRANGDWFAFESHGRLCVPLFLSSHDALMSRLRSFEILLFEPVALNAQLLKEVAPAGAGSNLDFRIVNDPLADAGNKAFDRRACAIFLAAFHSSSSVVLSPAVPVRLALKHC